MTIPNKKHDFKRMAENDPRRVDTVRQVAGYRDAIRELSEEDRNRYRGKVLAVLTETGEIIATADTAEELRKAVAASQFHARAWRLVDGPTDELRLTAEEAAIPSPANPPRD